MENIEELQILRRQLIQTMTGMESHLDFESVIRDFPLDKHGAKPKGVPHSAWQLLEHIRIAQWDILEFSRNPHHKSPKWPEEYWPVAEGPPDSKAWADSIEKFKSDAKAFASLITDEKASLFKPIEGGDGQTLLREACVVATHNSYHLGQLELLKKMLQS